jgi:hypothetical protein
MENKELFNILGITQQEFEDACVTPILGDWVLQQLNAAYEAGYSQGEQDGYNKRDRDELINRDMEQYEQDHHTIQQDDSIHDALRALKEEMNKED